MLCIFTLNMSQKLRLAIALINTNLIPFYILSVGHVTSSIIFICEFRMLFLSNLNKYSYHIVDITNCS